MSAEVVFCPSDLRVQPLGHDRVAIRNRFTGGAQVVDNNTQRALRQCVSAQSIEQHAARLEAQGFAPRPLALQHLRGWLEAGLLQRFDDVVSDLRQGCHEPHEVPRPNTICIPTVGRQQVLYKALKGFQRGAEIRFLVGDDSVTQAERDKTLAALKRPELIACRRFVIDRAGRQRMVEQLARHSGVEAEVIAFALKPDAGPFRSYGANRNALLLAMAGQPMVFADDDTTAPLQQLNGAPKDAATLSFSSDGHRVQLRFPDSGASRFPNLERYEGSLCDAHGVLLGRTSAQLLAQRQVDIQHVSSELLLRAGRPHARVRVTQLGSLGDSGTSTLAHYLLLAGRSRQRLFEDEARYGWAQRSRQVNVAVERPLVTDVNRCMGMALGLDASELLPPFAPLRRNADGLFGAMLSRCFAGALFGWSTAMVQHHPPITRRTSFEQTLDEMRGIDSNDLLGRLVAAAASAVPSADAAAELTRLGDTLQAWAAEPLVSFEGRLRDIVMRTRASDIRQLRQQLLRYDHEPSFWAQDVQRAIMTLEQAMIEPSHAWPRDMLAVLGEVPARQAFRRDVHCFGQVLSSWSAIFASAQACWPNLNDIADEVR